ncbi:MAG: bifunctional glycosyltransferase family 2/GtrA family protein [Antricoccus sp.]
MDSHQTTNFVNEIVQEARVTDVDLVIPVYNEELGLASAVQRLHAFASEHLCCSFQITIADNASTDDTWRIANELSREIPGVRVRHFDQKGRGRALSAVWQASEADVLVYMDVDLSTDLKALPVLIAPLLSGHSQVAIGTRLARSSQVVRGAKREFISRSYNVILRRSLGVRFSDAQCGFKAIRRDAALALLPLVEDKTWFFDTELLVLAERSGMRIHEVPVDWVDDPNSSVDITSTASDDLRGIWRLRRALSSGALPLARLRQDWASTVEGDHAPIISRRRALVHQLLRFGAVGVVSTAAYALLFLILETFQSAQVANFTALLVTAIGNTAMNRRFTFGIKGGQDAGRHQLQGIGVFLLGWGITSFSLTWLHYLNPTPPVIQEVGVLTAANLLATIVRFGLLRSWVFKKRQQSSRTPAPAAAARAAITETVNKRVAPTVD